MERRKIRKEEEKELEQKKKQLKKSYRKKDKAGARKGLRGITVTKMLIIVILIITPIIIYFVYDYLEAEKIPQYSILTEGDEIYGTVTSNGPGSVFNTTYTKTNIAYASTAQFMSLEINDEYPYHNTLYKANYTEFFSSALGIPYNVHPNDHHEAVDDCYMEFMFAFLHNVPSIFYVLRLNGGFIYPATLEWDYILKWNNLDNLKAKQEKYFYDPIITVDPADMQLSNSTEIKVNVTVIAGLYNRISFAEIKMTFNNTDNITFSNPNVTIGSVKSRGDQLIFTSRKNRIQPLKKIYLIFNVTVNSTESFTNKDILSSGRIFLQYKSKSIQDVYPGEGFNFLKFNLLGIPEKEQLEAFIYMLRLRYCNFIFDTPLIFDCTVS